MDKQVVYKVGGDIDSALKGDYQLDPKAILKEAWGHTQSNRKVINFALLTTLFIGLFIILIITLKERL